MESEDSLNAERVTASALSFPLCSLSRLGLILLLLQYSTEFLFYMARLFYFADENNEKL